MIINKKILSLILIIGLTLTILPGCIENQNGNGGGYPTGIIIIPGASADTNPKDAMASYYDLQELTITSNAQQYSLPLNLSNIINIDRINSYFQLSEEQETLLKTNGFVIIDIGYKENDTIEPYNNLKEDNIPIFITTDTLLHLLTVRNPKECLFLT